MFGCCGLFFFSGGDVLGVLSSFLGFVGGVFGLRLGGRRIGENIKVGLGVIFVAKVLRNSLSFLRDGGDGVRAWCACVSVRGCVRGVCSGWLVGMLGVFIVGFGGDIEKWYAWVSKGWALASVSGCRALGSLLGVSIGFLSSS